MSDTPNPAYSDTFISRLYYWSGPNLMVNLQRVTVPNPGYAQQVLVDQTRQVHAAEYEQAKKEADELAWEDALAAAEARGTW